MNKKGSLFVETAITLPLFFLALLSICVLIRVIGTEENTMRSFAEEGQRVAKEAYLTRLDIIPEGYSVEIAEGIAHGTLLELRVLERLKKEESIFLKEPRIDQFEYLFAEKGNTGLIRCSMAYGVPLPLPANFQRKLEFEQSLFFRGFIGAENYNEGMGFDRMEEPDDPETVYVFPRAGERFHQLDCRIIEVFPIELVLSPGVRKRYAPCKLCDADTLPWGSRVYCFDTSGKAFHKGSCTTVERYVIGIDREEAIEKGYSPCAFCGG